MIVTTSWISAKYNEFNNLYFNGMLPTVNFKINRTKRSWGMATYRYDCTHDTVIPESITISNYYDSPEAVKIQVLLHEMIHIADYFWHPEHFVRNGHKVSKRSYDAHGYWFLEEANRITNASGYKISPHVTAEEHAVSTLSARSRNIQHNKTHNALICAVIGTDAIWWFKTDVKNVSYLSKNIRTNYNWSRIIGDIKTIKFYTFDNPSLAARQSCRTRLNGWKMNKYCFMNKMEEYRATEVHF